MPDTNGKYYFSDFKAELVALGFDGFSDADLGVYVNRGYFHVARKSRWSWEQTTDTFTVAPGAAYVDIGPELPNFRSLDKLFVTTANYQKRIFPSNEDEFFTNWLSKDLTSASNRGEPTRYYIWNNRLYVTPPPRTSRDFVAHYRQRMTVLKNPTDQPVTPIHLDEAIIDAARQRAHMRAQEPTLAALARQDLDEFFDDMLSDDEEIMDEALERVAPDDTWL